MSFHKYKDLYFRLMPLPCIYTTLLGIDTGITVNNLNPPARHIEIYSNLIGYTSLGIITGVTYPISFPFFGFYVLFK